MLRNKYDSYKSKKEKITRRSPTVAEIKMELRKQFKERIKAMKQDSFNKKRILFEDYTVSERINDYNQLKKSLMETYDVPEDTDITEAFEQFEDEIKSEFENIQAQQFIAEFEDETNNILSCVINVCSVCEKYIHDTSQVNASTIICKVCAKKYFYSDSL